MMIGIGIIGMLIGAFLIFTFLYVKFAFEDWIDRKISNNTAITRGRVYELEKQIKECRECIHGQMMK